MNVLPLMAAPIFAVMALVTAIGGNPLDGFCGTSPLGGMAPMYLLMSIFHAGPWLRLLRRSERTSCSCSPHVPLPARGRGWERGI